MNHNNFEEMNNHGERRNAMKATDDAYKRALELRAFFGIDQAMKRDMEAGELIARATTDVAKNDEGHVNFVTKGSVTNEQEMNNHGERRNAMKATDDAYKRALELRAVFGIDQAMKRDMEAGELIARATTDVAKNDEGHVNFVTKGSVTNEQK